MSHLKAYWIGWCLLATSLICWSMAAILFEFTNHEFIISSLLQASGVFLALAIAYFFFEHGSQVRQAKIDATMELTVDQLRKLAKRAVITVVQQWKEHPHRHNVYGTQYEAPTYDEAREFVLGRSRRLEEYPRDIDSFDSLYWVFAMFENLALYSSQSFRTVGPSLVEHSVLIREMRNLENFVEAEKQAWQGFVVRTGDANSPLPPEASYNLLAIAEAAVRLLDVLDSKDFGGDPEYEARRPFAQPVRRLSRQWGSWDR